MSHLADVRFRHYLALGDSISIDLYPGLDVQEREDLLMPPEGLGAASLLFRNDDQRWPEFADRDLAGRFPGIGRTDLTADGAITETVVNGQLSRIPRGLTEPVLVTLTVGGNDLLELTELAPGRFAAFEKEGREAVAGIATAAEDILQQLCELLPGATVLVGTVYDPTDGTADLGDGIVRREEHALLGLLNRSLTAAARNWGAIPIDIHGHFLGHGMREPDPDARWYWRHNIIEPSARGASEVRRLWVEALGL